MKIMKGLLVWPLLWLLRTFHIGDQWSAPSREELRKQLIEYKEEFHQYEHPTDFWKHHQ